MIIKALWKRYNPLRTEEVPDHAVRTVVGFVRENDRALGVHALHEGLRDLYGLPPRLARRAVDEALARRYVILEYQPARLAQRYALTPRGHAWFADHTGHRETP